MLFMRSYRNYEGLTYYIDSHNTDNNRVSIIFFTPICLGSSYTNLMATITLKTPENTTETFECDEDTTILDALEEAGIDHPSSCRAGACSSCAMKIEEGTVNQEEQSFLDDDQMEEGYVLTCVALPTSDTITLLTEQEENLF